MFDDVYFVSNRNFSMETDTFFLIKIDPNAGNPDDLVSIVFVQSDTPYGTPPNAIQKVGFLQTNDARVLEAFRLDDEIQFVGNTRYLDNNMAGIYHGIIEDVTNPQIQLTQIIGSDYELGYPGITYTGETASDRDAIIAFNHTSKTRNPGVSALYSIPGEGYSNIVQLGQGNNYVDMLNNTDLERWGDYLGTQRDYNDPQTVWVAGFIGVGAKMNAPLICRVQRPENPTDTEEIQIEENTTTVFPNPLVDRASIEFTVAENTKSINVDLYTISGKKVGNIYTSNNVKKGKNSFSFDTSILSKGTYVIKVVLDNKIFKSENIVKM